MITALAYRYLNGWIRRHRMLLIVCGMILGFSATNVHAHSPMPSPVLAVTVNSDAAVHYISATVYAEEPGHAGQACPSNVKHTNHQTCIGGFACHAMTVGSAIHVDMYARRARYEPNATGAGNGHEVAPLFHPPKL
jgi:hypothetical protein